MGDSLLTRLRFRTTLWCQARSMPFRVTPDRPLAWVLSFADRTPRARYAGLSPEYILNSAAAGSLQRAGLIRYKRGNVTIINRRGLMGRSCECYGVSKREFDRLLGDRAMRRGPLP